eukprot:TRINITY_DN1074_c3_g1_i1.p1 TRINITY_DN1074_c3_g1~~TRINITY_DN1074_c3_g1_i1.p1  ORF type:complete len:1134 (+),score=145.42 TRINITY_DN1074_c3_g1_i1:403-3402(+)
MRPLLWAYPGEVNLDKVFHYFCSHLLRDGWPHVYQAVRFCSQHCPGRSVPFFYSGDSFLADLSTQYNKPIHQVSNQYQHLIPLHEALRERLISIETAEAMSESETLTYVRNNPGLFLGAFSREIMCDLAAYYPTSLELLGSMSNLLVDYYGRDHSLMRELMKLPGGKLIFENYLQEGPLLRILITKYYRRFHLPTDGVVVTRDSVARRNGMLETLEGSGQAGWVRMNLMLERNIATAVWLFESTTLTSDLSEIIADSASVATKGEREALLGHPRYANYPVARAFIRKQERLVLYLPLLYKQLISFYYPTPNTPNRRKLLLVTSDGYNEAITKGNPTSFIRKLFKLFYGDEAYLERALERQLMVLRAVESFLTIIHNTHCDAEATVYRYRGLHNSLFKDLEAEAGLPGFFEQYTAGQIRHHKILSAVQRYRFIMKVPLLSSGELYRSPEMLRQLNDKAFFIKYFAKRELNLWALLTYWRLYRPYEELSFQEAELMLSREERKCDDRESAFPTLTTFFENLQKADGSPPGFFHRFETSSYLTLFVLNCIIRKGVPILFWKYISRLYGRMDQFIQKAKASIYAIVTWYESEMSQVECPKAMLECSLNPTTVNICDVLRAYDKVPNLDRDANKENNLVAKHLIASASELDESRLKLAVHSVEKLGGPFAGFFTDQLSERANVDLEPVGTRFRMFLRFAFWYYSYSLRTGYRSANPQRNTNRHLDGYHQVATTPLQLFRLVEKWYAFDMFDNIVDRFFPQETHSLLHEELPYSDLLTIFVEGFLLLQNRGSLLMKVKNLRNNLGQLEKKYGMEGFFAPLGWKRFPSAGKYFALGECIRLHGKDGNISLKDIERLRPWELENYIFTVLPKNGVPDGLFVDKLTKEYPRLCKHIQEFLDTHFRNGSCTPDQIIMKSPTRIPAVLQALEKRAGVTSPLFSDYLIWRPGFDGLCALLKEATGQCGSERLAQYYDQFGYLKLKQQLELKFNRVGFCQNLQQTRNREYHQ